MRTEMTRTPTTGSVVQVIKISGPQVGLDAMISKRR
jgi:hypothetical protein